MPKRLYLLRHADSLEKTIGQTDRERELSQAGMRQCYLIGKHLTKNNRVPEKVFCSTALRAKTTAELVAENIGIDPEKIVVDEQLYDASVRTFLEFIQSFDNALNSVMCVGHNPVMSYLAEYLTRAEIGSMGPGSIAMISFPFTAWKDAGQANGTLEEYFVPRGDNTNE